MLLSRLTESLLTRELRSTADPDITSVVYDSRRVSPGALFVCIRGGTFDGHDFIPQVIGAGAAALVVDMPERVPADAHIPVVVVTNTRDALPILANSFYDHPSRRLKLVGITGTNGKTTTTYLIESMLRHAGRPTGVVGTLGALVDGIEVETDRTTPESVDLQALFAKMVSEGIETAAMEVSSHALYMRRTVGCEFDIGVFTNLTQDHLDFHKTLEEYFDTKLMLFREYPKLSDKPFTSIVNVDDPYGERVVQATFGKALTYGVRSPADIRASGIHATARGIEFHAVCPAGEFDVRMRLGGLFNVYNSLAAIGVGVVLGLSAEEITAGLEAVPAVSGRFESVDCGQDFAVIVDYAHTPDGLENVLRSAREIAGNRLLVVFGCGGDRDRAKRPIMGRIASELADVCIVTSDNPRSEEPQAIIDEVLTGINGSGRASVEVVADRRDAIRRAVEKASVGDIVVIAGKGHETYQIFRDRTIHFDDREVVRDLLGCKP